MRKVKLLAKIFGVAVLFVIAALPVGGLLSQVNASDSFEYQTLSEYKGTYSKGEWATISNASDKSAKSDGPQWSILHTPGSIAGKKEILSPSEVNKIAVAADGTTIWTVDTPAKAVRKSSYNGWSWSDTPNSALHRAMTSAGIPQDNQFVWDVVIAPDNSEMVAVVTGSATSPDPTEVWMSTTGGTQWGCTGFSTISGGAIIGAIDISMKYAGNRDIAVGARDGIPSAFRIWVLQIPGFNSWKLQTIVPVANADVLALRFSPTYFGDSALTVVYCANDATYFDIAIRDRNPSMNDIVSWVFPSGIEVKDPASPPGASPEATTIVTADLELPSDFMGQDTNLRRAYISTDDTGAGSDTGIFRIDDATVFRLTDTTTGPIAGRRISSIAYHGTYASGKLLAGEVLGYPCTTIIPTWFTDAPTECPIPCWYPALKPPTGAAAQGTCNPSSQDGFGNAQVAYSSSAGRVAYCGTSSADFSNGGVNTAPGSGCWPAALINSVALDESAFSLTRNNGETWNQLGLIDTKIDKLTDVAPSADSSTLYLASTNLADASATCAGFDSVWRSSTNANIVAPLPAQSIGTVWERVLCRQTSLDCTQEQTNMGILRLAPDKEDGEIVLWAAQGTRAQAWSPDYGDYWANITARWPIQDFVLESSMVLYNLSPIGLIQKMPYTGTAWSTTLPNVDTVLGSAYSITALAGGHVLVGGGISSMFPVAYSNNGAKSFTPIIQPLAVSNIIVAFDDHFKSNRTIYAATHKTSGGSIYCNTVPKYTKWTDLKPRGLGYYGIAIDDQGVLYVANPSFVEYMRGPIQSKSKKTNWDALTTGLPGSICLTLSPDSLKLSNDKKNKTLLYVIDNNSYNPAANIGMVWTYTDTVPRTLRNP
jgi:hypothetical protein